MLYYWRAFVKPLEKRNFELSGKEAAHALEPLVDNGV